MAYYREGFIFEQVVREVEDTRQEDQVRHTRLGLYYLAWHVQ